MAAPQLVRYAVPLGIGTTFLFQGSILADSIMSNRPNPAAVYAEPSRPERKCSGAGGSGMASNEPAAASAADADTDPFADELGGCQDTELERLVMSAREGLGPYKNHVMCYIGQAANQATLLYEKVQDNLCYLRTGAPQEVRIGTIVAGGLTGMLMGVRRGLARKLLFGSLGTAGGAYVAYPEETEKYTKKYTSIAYNFIAGPRK